MSHNTSHGWIKLYRSLLNDPICTRPEYCHVWIILLLMSQHKPVSFIHCQKNLTLRPGQLVTGRKTLSLQTGVCESKIERILKYLENEQKIEQQKFTKFRIITIRNNDFSGSDANSEQKFEQQVDSKCTTNEQQVDTYNKDKNVKNERTPYIPQKGEGGISEGALRLLRMAGLSPQQTEGGQNEQRTGS
jgi:hypothetical protein